MTVMFQRYMTLFVVFRMERERGKNCANQNVVADDDDGGGGGDCWRQQQYKPLDQIATAAAAAAEINMLKCFLTSSFSSFIYTVSLPIPEYTHTHTHSLFSFTHSS